jgi:CYTH domain-containing protein
MIAAVAEPRADAFRDDDVAVARRAKYAHIEREVRFRLPGLPDMPAGCRVLRIDDRYLLGTRLRLRRVEEAGQAPLLKLGHKVRLDPATPVAVAHTTVYLTAAEYDVLAALPAHGLRKARHLAPVGDGVHVAVDVFDGALAGMVTAEIDLGGRPDGVAGLTGRDGLRALLAGGVEVTGDEAHTAARWPLPVLPRSGRPWTDTWS